MRNYLKKPFIFLKLSFLVLLLCSNSWAINNENSTQSTLTKNAWMREILSDQTLFYARIPSIWNNFSFKEDTFKKALGSTQNNELITALQSSSQRWLQQADPLLTPLLNLLAGQLNGPIEMAATVDNGMPKLLVSIPLKYENDIQVKELISSLLGIGLVKDEFQKLADNAGVLNTSIGALPYRWDPQHKRLQLLVSFGGSSLAHLDESFGALKSNSSHSMLLNEKQMDSSLQGLYVWFNNQKARPLYEMMLPTEPIEQLASLGLLEVETVALSLGVLNEKGRLKLQLNTPADGKLRKLLPIYNNNLTIASVGTPKYVMLLGLPSTEELKIAEDVARELLGELSDYSSVKKVLAKSIGAPVEDILSAVGPELLFISDNSGEYLALKLSNPKAFKLLTEKLQLNSGASIETELLNGKETVHLTLPSIFSGNNSTGLSEIPFVVRDLVSKMGSHVYWQTEGDFLIISQLPQKLKDRQYLLLNNYIFLKQWLLENQKQNFSSSGLALSGVIEQAPQRLYYGYLTLMQALADVTDAKINISSMPSATELGLPEKGTYGFQLDSDEQKIGFEIVFESTPLDALLTVNGAATAAITAATFALITPIYEEAEFKNTVSSAQNSGAKAKLRLLSFYIDHKRLPNEKEAEEIVESLDKNDQYKFELSSENGEISLIFTNVGYQLDRDRLQYIPSISNGSIEWRCVSDLSRKYRPRQCKCKYK
jgi:hypothetical protein